MLFEIATISSPLLALAETAARARDWALDREAKGDLLGCWRSDIGTLGRVIVLRGFEGPDALAEERQRALFSAAPFGATPETDLSMESHAPFPFLPPVQPGRRGRFYEFRTYRLKPGGIGPTLSGWEAAIGPAHAYTAHLVVNMYALDGAPRITHIWGFDTLEQRDALRSAHYAAGLWPPPGGPEQIVEAVSVIGKPDHESPLQ